jgi:hypothetical protein
MPATEENDSMHFGMKPHEFVLVWLQSFHRERGADEVNSVGFGLNQYQSNDAE